MNILLLAKENNGGGLVTHVIDLANTLKRKGHNVSVAAPLDNGEEKRFSELECEFYPLNLATKNPRVFLRNIRSLEQIVKEKRIDIIHSHNRISSIYAQILRKRLGVKFIWTLHLNNIPSNLIARWMTFYGEKAIVVSSDMIPFCERNLGIPRKDILVVYNGVNEEHYRVLGEEEKESTRQKYGIKPGQKVIVLLSRLDPVKGHKVLLEAIDGLSGEFVVLFTGESMMPGYKDELVRIIKAKGLEDVVRFVGYVNPVEILNISDLFVLPSENEGFPISIIEAFFLRVPVIRTKTGGYNDVKEYVFLMHNKKDLKEKLALFMSGHLEVESRAEEGYQFAMNNCTCNVMAEKVLSIYREVLE